MKTGLNLFLITLLSLALFACSGTGSTTNKEDDRANRLQVHDSSLTLADYLVRPVDSILSVQVLKGADASTLSGMDGSNGAIVIRTKHNE